jgi:F0F1-type ATP synthase epsilon subunit
MADDASKSIPVKSADQPDGSAGSDASTPKEMHVKVYSPFKVYYEGSALSISAESATGPFDILGQHHNFITLLRPCELVVRTANNDEKIQIDGGVMHVKADDIVVFLDV